jgi:hypothetical protein
MQQYSDLFSIIYNGSINSEQIDYLELRNKLKKNISILFLLPKDLQEIFKNLGKIYFSNPKYYDEHEKEISKVLKEAVICLDKYGVDIFGIK